MVRLLIRSAALLGVVLALASCQLSQPTVSGLAPTLTTRQLGGGTVAFQSGIPVPSFTDQPRSRIDLDSGWLEQDAHLDETLTFSDRHQSLRAIENQAHGRMQKAFDDHAWRAASVPGGINPPPQSAPTGAWYRIHFTVPTGWPAGAVTLKFGAVNYLADVWLNGQWLGYHEGGSTSFAFDAGPSLAYGADNVLAVRVYDPPFGSRLDVVPWGLTDFWNYAGIIGPVWLEATGSPAVVRADVIPHLDAADLNIVVENRSDVTVSGTTLTVVVNPALVTDANRLDANPLHLVPADSSPVVTTSLDAPDLPAHSARVLNTQIEFADPSLWSPTYPALYVLQIGTEVHGVTVDQFADTFGLRTIRVDPAQPRLLLNGEPIELDGAAIHNESVTPARADGDPHGGRWQSTAEIQNTLDLAAGAGVNLIRADHSPAEPNLLMLTDRTGFTVWEEIPLYHETPQTFAIAADRGIAVQMLEEMDLRDMNRPSVLFHGFANEGLGTSERTAILDQLSQAEHHLDGTRLTGQAMYGSDPTDPTSQGLDVAGYTLYEGVFYGQDADKDTAAALRLAHATYPNKPLLVLEFGRWSDSPSEEAAQAQLFRQTWDAIEPVLTTQSHGYVAGAVWWALQDYWSDQASNPVEHFGMFRADGRARQVAKVAASSFTGRVAVANLPVVQSGGTARIPQGPDFLFLGLLVAYAFGFAVAAMALIALVLSRRRSRHLGR